MLYINDCGTGGSDSGDMVVQEDTIFVSGMDTETTEDDIANHFGAIGIIKVKIFCYFVYKMLHTNVIAYS